jgi:hypothetical protein
VEEAVNDIDRQREKVRELAAKAQLQAAVDIGTVALNAIVNIGEPEEQIVGLQIALLAAADALELPRDLVVKTLQKLAGDVKLGVFEVG